MRRFHINVRTVLTTAGIMVLLTVFFSWKSTMIPSQDDCRFPLKAWNGKRRIVTAIGRLSYAQVEAMVFRPFNFTIVKNCHPLLILNFVQPLYCDAVFHEWINIARRYDPTAIPIRSIPINDRNAYSLNGASIMTEEYSNDNKPNPQAEWVKKIRWSAASIAFLMNRSDVYMISGYRSGAASVQTAFERYGSRLMDKHGLVVGSITPWVEVMALQQGAKTVTTVEYTSLPDGDARLRYLHPMALAMNWTNYNYDFIASFSSIEHSGLGRYGDSLDPIGDLRKMKKLLCLTRPGGLLFIGLPIGRDQVTFNLHRIYGTVRLSMIFTGWHLIDVFFDDDKDSYPFSAEDVENYRDVVRQMLFVLEKV